MKTILSLNFRQNISKFKTEQVSQRQFSFKIKDDKNLKMTK